MEASGTKKRKPSKVRAPSGPWIETNSGKKFDLLNPTAGMIDISDIAEHLSKICRYIGACPRFYSVAEHCIIGSRLIPEQYKLSFLLHDAHEAYIGDISRPLKWAIQGLWPEQNNSILKKITQKIDSEIYMKYHPLISNCGYDIIQDHYSMIKDFDNAMLLAEAKHFGFDYKSWNLPPIKAKISRKMFEDEFAKICFLDMSAASHLYQREFQRLGGKI